MQDKIKRLAEEHWQYIENLLNVSMKTGIYTKQEMIDNVKFHYLTAWEHGAKHYSEMLDGKTYEKQQ